MKRTEVTKKQQPKKKREFLVYSQQKKNQHKHTFAEFTTHFHPFTLDSLEIVCFYKIKTNKKKL